MKEEFENSSVDLEHLLRTKNWNQLSPAEQDELKNVLSGREEYERLYAMVHQLKTVTGVHDTDLVPSAGLRENLLTAFEDEQRKRRSMWWSGLWYRMSSVLRFDIPAVRIGFAAVLLVVGVLTVFNLMNKDESAPVIAKEDNVQPAPESVKENPGTDNHITVIPEQNDNEVQPAPQNVVTPDDNLQVAPASVNNGMQVVDGNAPVVVDTNANRFVMNPVDTNALVVAPLTFNVTNGGTLCCATSNGTVLAAGTNDANYVWTNSGSNALTGVTNGTVNVVTVNGLPPRARALSNDAQVLDVFFAVK